MAAASRLFDLAGDRTVLAAMREWAEAPTLERVAFYEAVVAAARETLATATAVDARRRALYLLCGSPRCDPAPGRVPAARDSFCPDGSGTRGEELTAGELLFGPPADYTAAAQKARVEGMVKVMACVDRRGKIEDLYVERRLPLGLSEEALHTVEGWRFRPARRGEEPVRAIYRLIVDFELD